MESRVVPKRASVVGCVEAIEQAHVGDSFWRTPASQNEFVASGLPYQVIDDMKKSILEHHLGGRSFVEALLGIRRVIVFLDAEDGIGIPHLLLCDWLA